MAKQNNIILRKIVAKSPGLDLPMKTENYRQEIRFSFKDLPEAKNWKVGEEYQITLEVEQVSMDKDGARFAIEKVGTKKIVDTAKEEKKEGEKGEGDKNDKY
jgi:hypothetical protein